MTEKVVIAARSADAALETRVCLSIVMGAEVALCGYGRSGELVMPAGSVLR